VNRRLRVVIVEDEDLIRKGLVLATDWQKMGCLVVGEASDAFEGEKVIRMIHPDIVFTDVCMPRKTGLEMIESLSDLDGIEYVILSGFADFAYAQKAIELQVCRYLLKPVEDEQLYDIVDEIKSERERKQRELSLENDKLALISFGDYRDQYVDKVISYLSSNFSDPMKVCDMALNLNISESTLLKSFRARTGYSINEFVVRQRMRVALMLLKENKLNIAQIGEYVGYKDGRYFSETFKRSFSVTPIEFKKGLTQITDSEMQNKQK